ncbi:hypothetical protein LB513_16955 [Mesorhizobium sp. ES1-1]|nr:hypothetical protein [Mesorhizobium sp. ES1-1]
MGDDIAVDRGGHGRSAAIAAPAADATLAADRDGECPRAVAAIATAGVGRYAGRIIPRCLQSAGRTVCYIDGSARSAITALAALDLHKRRGERAMDSRSAVSAAPATRTADERGLPGCCAANRVRTRGRRHGRVAVSGIGTADPVITIRARRTIRVDRQLLRMGRGLSVKGDEPEQSRRTQQEG